MGDVLAPFEPAVRLLAPLLLARRWRLATAESCTGGMIAAACTTVPGSSDWFERGFVAYSNEAKHDMLGVPIQLIAQHGAVSEEVAQSMAEGAMLHSRANVALSVTGIAGPGGGSPAKPVGTVWLGLAIAGRATQTELLTLKGDRAAVREQTLAHALSRLLQI